MRSGTRVFALASIAAGAINLVWGDFATDWQPIQAFGDHVVGRAFLAYLTALWLVVAGAALLGPRTQRAGAAGLAAVYGIFAIFWLPRLYFVPHLLGFNLPRIIGVLDGLGQQLILVAAAVLTYASLTTAAGAREPASAALARVTFGLCAVIFGVAHFTGTSDVVPLVPHWMPFGGTFWAIVTGTGFILSGVAIVTRWFGAPAARLLALMLAIFSAVVWVPQLFRFTHEQAAWGGNAYNLAAVAAAWIVADWLTRLAKSTASSRDRR
jgi:uncharacterized membrane protein